MGLLGSSMKALGSEHVIMLAATIIVLPMVIFLAATMKNPGSLFSFHNDKKISNNETILVGMPEEAGWSWFKEMRARSRYTSKGHHLTFAAFKEHTGRILRAPLGDYSFYILPHHYMQELKSLPQNILSSSKSIEDYLSGQYTTMTVHNMMGDITWNTLRSHLTQKLPALVEPLDDSCKKAFRDELPDCTEWTPINVHPTFLHIVGRMTGRMMVGEKLSTARLFLDTYVKFATSVFVTSSILKVLPAIFRPFAAPFIPDFWRIRKIHRNNWKMLAPVVKGKLRESKAEAEKRKASGSQDMLDWLIEASVPKPDVGKIITRLLGIAFAAIHTTTNHISNVIFDLAYRWDEYAPELITEYREAIAEDGGTLQKGTLLKLSKLDSFMKESMRLNPPSSLSFNRKVMKDYTLSDGRVLPKSSWIAVAAGPLMLTESEFKDPLKFDGFRYHRMRQEGSEESMTAAAKTSHFTSTGPYSLVFGHGRFACPGRFFAGVESKLMLIHILENYELRLPEGTTRPVNLTLADAGFPDPAKAVLFRKLAK